MRPSKPHINAVTKRAEACGGQGARALETLKRIRDFVGFRVTLFSSSLANHIRVCHRALARKCYLREGAPIFPGTGKINSISYIRIYIYIYI